MSFWANNDRPTILSDAEDLAHAPEPSPWTKWFMGSLMPVAVLIYCLYSIYRGSIILPGDGGSITVTGDDLLLLAIAYIALAAFVHVHCVWCLHEKLWVYANPVKIMSLLIFLPCLLIVLYHQFGF